MGVNNLIELRKFNVDLLQAFVILLTMYSARETTYLPLYEL